MADSMDREQDRTAVRLGKDSKYLETFSDLEHLNRISPRTVVSIDRKSRGNKSATEGQTMVVPERKSELQAVPMGEGEQARTSNLQKRLALDIHPDGQFALHFANGIKLTIDPKHSTFRHQTQDIRIGPFEVSLRPSAEGFQIQIDGVQITLPTDGQEV